MARERRTRVIFGPLDFLYTPSSDAAADMTYFADVLGAEIVFAIDGGEDNGRVAAVRLNEGGPFVLFAEHLDGQRPILIFRTDDLEGALAEIEARGWQRDETFEIPHGPCCTFDTPTGHRLGLYQLTRPEIGGHFARRRDF